MVLLCPCPGVASDPFRSQNRKRWAEIQPFACCRPWSPTDPVHRASASFHGSSASPGFPHPSWGADPTPSPTGGSDALSQTRQRHRGCACVESHTDPENIYAFGKAKAVLCRIKGEKSVSAENDVHKEPLHVAEMKRGASSRVQTVSTGRRWTAGSCHPDGLLPLLRRSPRPRRRGRSPTPRGRRRSRACPLRPRPGAGAGAAPSQTWAVPRLVLPPPPDALGDPVRSRPRCKSGYHGNVSVGMWAGPAGGWFEARVRETRGPSRNYPENFNKREGKRGACALGRAKGMRARVFHAKLPLLKASERPGRNVGSHKAPLSVRLGADTPCSSCRCSHVTQDSISAATCGDFSEGKQR